MSAALTTLVGQVNSQAVTFLTDWLPLVSWGVGIALGIAIASWVVSLFFGRT